MRRLMAALKPVRRFRSSREKKSESEAHSSIEWVVAASAIRDEYARSRHNAGFMTIDRVAKKNGVALSRKKSRASSATSR